MLVSSWIFCSKQIDLDQSITAAVFFHWFKLRFIRYCAVDAVEDLLADFSYLGLRGRSVA